MKLEAGLRDARRREEVLRCVALCCDDFKEFVYASAVLKSVLQVLYKRLCSEIRDEGVRCCVVKDRITLCCVKKCCQG